MKRNQTQINLKQKGFSLIEVILAIFLITIGLITATSLVVVGLKESMDSRNQVTAGLLAQEGLELVRNIRDTNWVNNRSSFVGIGVGNSCRIDVLVTSLNCDSNQSKLLKFDEGNSLYNHTSGNDTKFSRNLSIAADGPNETVLSMVVWDRTDFPNENDCNSASKCAYVKTTLTTWGE